MSQGDFFQKAPEPVYVDKLFTMQSTNPQAFRLGLKTDHLWCHMWSEDTAALHAMAERIGLKREWFQNKPGFPHYDLTPNKRALALKHGALQTSLPAWIVSRRRRKQPAVPLRPAVGTFDRRNDANVP